MLYYSNDVWLANDSRASKVLLTKYIILILERGTNRNRECSLTLNVERGTKGVLVLMSNLMRVVE